MAKINRIKNRQTTPIKVGFHRKKKIQRWNYIIHDEYAIRAQKEWYRARSVYKLLEIQKRFELIKPDMSVIDIGCAPWSFLQALHTILEKVTLIVWVDIKPMTPLGYNNIRTIECDIFDFEKLKNALHQIYDWPHIFDFITSDIAPNTTGRFDIDQYASVELNIAICQFADAFLREWGNMILKVFQWEDFYELSREVKKRFHEMKTYKPVACRDSSHEEYVICLGKKPCVS